MLKLFMGLSMLTIVAAAKYPITPSPNSCEARLLEAVQKKENLPTIKKIVEKERCNVNAEFGFGETALYLASFMGYEDVVEYLLKKGAKIDPVRQTDMTTPLLLTLQTGNLSMAKLLLKHNADVNKRDRKHESAFLQAVILNKIDFVNTLLKANADINLADGEGNTPLMIAAFNGNEAMVDFLLKHHANINSVQGQGGTALILAKAKGHYVIVKKLEAAGAK